MREGSMGVVLGLLQMTGRRRGWEGDCKPQRLGV